MNQKLEFIYHELEDWAKYVDGKLRAEFTKKKIGFSEELLRSLHYEVFNASGGNDGEFRLSFLEYGRMLDMGAGRERKHSISGNRNAYRKVSDNKIRKPKKWYSPTTYGSLNRLIGTLVNGYQHAAIDSIKNSLSALN